MARTTLAIFLLLVAATNGFLARTPGPNAIGASRSCSSSRAAACRAPVARVKRPASALRMMGGGVESVSPVLLAQLAGCAALVGTGKVLLKQEEEEGIEPAAPWCVGRWWWPGHRGIHFRRLIECTVDSITPCPALSVTTSHVQGGGAGAHGGGGHVPGHVGALLRVLQRGASAVSCIIFSCDTTTVSAINQSG